MVQTDTTEFPTLRVTIQMNQPLQPIETDFRVLDESKDTLQFSLSPIGGEEEGAGGRVVFFLIDASGYTEGLPLENFKKAVNESIDELILENDVINVGYFNRPQEDASVLRMLSYEFTRNLPQIKDRVRNKITTALEDSLGGQSIAFKAIKEALDFIGRSPDKGRRLLIVISGAPDNTNTAFTTDDLIDLAERNEVVINTINFKINNAFTPDIYARLSLNTQGQSTNARTSTDIKNAIGDIMESRAESENPGVQQYLLTFITRVPADGNLHQYTVLYRNEPPVVINYPAPGVAVSGGGNFFANYWWLIFIVGGLVLGLAYYYYNEMQIRRQEEEEAEAELLAQQEEEKRRIQQQASQQVESLREQNIRLQEQLRFKEQELARKIDEVPTVVPSQKIDPKNTIIGSGGGAPVLKVVAGSFNQAFRLNKPTITIGRAANNDIAIPEQTVSSKHATITVQNGSFFINDLGSTNGTFVNGSRIDSKILKSGDLIKFGAAQARFEI
ncbi:MAG: hypothetical protein OHK0053_22610 [Microscillaceae bacterium]